MHRYVQAPLWSAVVAESTVMYQHRWVDLLWRPLERVHQVHEDHGLLHALHQHVAGLHGKVAQHIITLSKNKTQIIIFKTVAGL
jgi:hypothetical protein